MQENKITVRAFVEYDESDIAGLLRDIESKTDNFEFFFTFEWLANWISLCSTKPILIKFYHTDILIGIAFLGIKKGSFGFTYYLNQSGNEIDDQVWIEHNDVICYQMRQECRDALLSFIASQPNVFKFSAINAVDTDWYSEHWYVWSLQTVKAYLARFNKHNLLTHFSKNTRSQISRSKSYITKRFGAVNFECVTQDNLDKSFSEISELHILQWGKHVLGSGFNNQKFVAFHKSLLLKTINNKTVILKYQAGELLLGFLYFFIKDKKVYFYLSAINHGADDNNKYKPGVIMHFLAMEYFAKQGYSNYDFLAGEARYKASLSNQEYQLHTIHLVLNKWFYQPLRFLVSMKRFVTQYLLRNIIK